MMSRFWQYFLYVELEFLTTQSFLVNDDDEICRAFGHRWFLATGNLLCHNRFFWSPMRKDVSHSVVFAFYRLGSGNVTIIGCGGQSGKMCHVCQCLLFADK